MSISVKTFTSAGEAAQAVGRDDRTFFLGGGTLVMRAMNEGSQAISTLVRTTDQSLQNIDIRGDDVSLGGGVTMGQILATRALEVLHPVAKVVGGPAVRSMATVGGNIFARHPYGDFAVALLVLDANASLADGRAVSVEDVIRSRDQGTNPIVQSVSFRRPRPGDFRFKKIMRVKPIGAAMLTIAAHLPGSSTTISGARVAYGAMGPAPMRVPSVEQALDGKRLDERGIADALAVATTGLEPPTDALASSWYRQEVAPVHLKRLLLEGRVG